MTMMLPLLLLAALVCPGLSDDTHIPYGDTLSLRLYRRADSLEFVPARGTRPRVLWRRYQPPAVADGRHTVTASLYEVHNLTPDDSGLYTVRDRDQNALYSRTVEVIANTESHTRESGEELFFAFDLDSNSCNIHFIPDSYDDWEKSDTPLVHRGELRVYEVDGGGCGGFEMAATCGMVVRDLRPSCSGRFEVRDARGNAALVVSLQVKALSFYSPYLSIGVAVFSTLCCCHCVRRCCCGNGASKEDSPGNDAAAAEPAAPAAAPAAAAAAAARPAAARPAFDFMPVRPRPDQSSQPSRAQSPARPSFASTGVPVSASAAAQGPDAATLPLNSEAEPRFEVKGMTFPSALSSDSTSCDVYTSDKLNFL